MNTMRRNPEGIAEAIRKAHTVALVSHVNPDGDTIGGVLAMRLILEKLHKEVTLFCDGKVPDSISILPGAELFRVPEGTEGRFQGVRMCFTVLIPMIIGPVISLIIGLDAMGMNGENFVPPYAMFLAAALVAVLAAVPVFFVRKNSR